MKHSNRIRSLRKTIKRLDERIERLVADGSESKKQLRVLMEEKQELEGKLQTVILIAEKARTALRRLQEPPTDYAIFIRPHPGGEPDEVDVLYKGELMKVTFAVPEMKVEDLKCGWEVLLADALVGEKRVFGVVEVTGQYWRLGQQQYGVFLRPHPGGLEDEIDVLLKCSGGTLVKGILGVSDIQVNDLKCGWEVIINDYGIVTEVNKAYPIWGEQVRFSSRLDEETVLVTNQINDAIRCFLSPELRSEKLKKDDLLLNCDGVIVKILPKTDQAEHFMDLEEVSGYGWSRLGGLDEAVVKIQTALLPFKYPKEYREDLRGKDPDRGMFLHGPQGCGKTSLAKCIAAELGRYRDKKCYFMAIVSSKFSDKFKGETARKLREFFARAGEKTKEGALVVVFIDELDALFRDRDATARSETWMPEDVGTFNTILDGIEPLGDIFVVAASNHKHLVDAAITRPGRLGIDIYVPRPETRHAISKILRIYLTEDLPFDCKYFEADVHEYKDYFCSGKKQKVRLNKSRKRIQAHFIDAIIRRLLYTGPPVTVKMEEDNERGEKLEIDNSFRRVTSRSDDKQDYLKNHLSGASLKSIVEGARRSALKRYDALVSAGQKPDRVEIKKKDFFKAIDEELKRLKHSFKKSEQKPISGYIKK